MSPITLAHARAAAPARRGAPAPAAAFERARALARVALLDAMIRVLHHERAVAALDADPSEPASARAVSALTEQLLTEGLVSPGELMFMHQRAQLAADEA